MKVFFWNIGSTLTERKLDLIKEAIEGEMPDIFCIAEGSHSIIDCEKLNLCFEEKKYFCYYSPLFSKKEELLLGYDYNRNGLKIFCRDERQLQSQFQFSLQRHEGRIVVLHAYVNFKITTFIFLHNKSKGGSNAVDLAQMPFILTLREMIDYGKITSVAQKLDIMKNTERVIIIGDFNLEPWDEVLKHKDFLSTSFFRNHNGMKQRNNSINHYFNPVVELLTKSDFQNLGGTYYSDSVGWALFDYVLYNTSDCDISYEIVVGFKGGSKLLEDDVSIKKSFLRDGLDHLPISTTITD